MLIKVSRADKFMYCYSRKLLNTKPPNYLPSSKLQKVALSPQINCSESSGKLAVTEHDIELDSP